MMVNLTIDFIFGKEDQVHTYLFLMFGHLVVSLDWCPLMDTHEANCQVSKNNLMGSLMMFHWYWQMCSPFF